MDVNKANVKNLYPLTPLQEGMLFHALAEREGPAYFQQIAYLIRGPFREDCFRQAWQILFDRHDVLRTVFAASGAERPLQVVLKERAPMIEKEDLRGLDAEAQAARRGRIKARDRQRGFDLAHDVLMRFTLLQLQDDLLEVLWSHHHILLDGWSLGLLLGEFTTLYRQLVAGQPPELPPAVPFSSYVKWLEGQDQEGSLAFWRDYLDGYDQEVGIPFTRWRKSAGTAQRQRRRFVIDQALAKDLARLCEQQQVTLNSALQAAWGLLLANYNDVDDVVFGAAVSGRPHDIPGIESMVGLFINTIPVRVRLEPAAKLGELLQAVQQQSLRCVSHHHSPLSKVQAGRRLVSTHVTLENFPLDDQFRQAGQASSDGLSIEANEIVEQTHYDFDIQFIPTPDGIKVQLAYDGERFDDGLMENVESHLEHILRRMVEAPDAPLVELSLPVEPIGTPHSASAYRGLVERFEAHAVSRSDAVALCFEGQQLGYGELNRRANRLAHRLLALDLPRDAMVGLYLERSLEQVIAILAVLKAGYCYVPLDTVQPEARLGFMVDDARLPVVLQHGALPLPLQRSFLQTLDVGCAARTGDEENPGIPLLPDRLAYVIYTSGSTGQPKGVMVSHGNMARLFSTCEEGLFDFSSLDVWTLFHSYAFDFSVWEIWGALAYGGRLVVVPYWVSRSPADFRQLLQQEGVTVLNQTPTAFRQLIEADRAAEPPLSALRYVVFGGEALEFKALKGWYERYPDRLPLLVNMYGITETTVHVTYRAVSRDDLDCAGSLIGRPLPDLRLLLLDRHGRPLPEGVPGELYVGGAGVSRGYLNRDELTAERFVTRRGERYYRSGDRARRLPGGDLEYLGRFDEQVQLRGFRVETGEIEKCLLQHPAVDKALALVREMFGEPQLVAYVLGAQGGQPLAGPLREHLGRLLPPYMVPAHFVALESLPLTANGKVDRTALPAPAVVADGGTKRQPRTPQESALAKVWSQVLRCESVGIDDNYFALGGDSIQAIQIVSRLAKEGYRAEIRDLFRYPSIAELAPWLRAAGAAKPSASGGGPFALTPVQRRFFAAELHEAQRYNHAALLRSRHGLWNEDALRAAWRGLLSRHDMLRACFLRQDGEWSQQIAEGEWEAPLRVIELEGDFLAALNRRADALQGELLLEQPPLLRLALYRGDGEERLLIVIHHLLVDGIGWRILLEDFAAGYAAALRGETAALPEATDSYRWWAESLVKYSRASALLEELPYWLEAAGTPAAVPAELPGEGNLYRDADALWLDYDAEATRVLLADANLAYATSTEDLLLAALAVTLEQWLGRGRTLILLEGHGREPVVEGIDVSRTVGWFTSLFPFALDVPERREPGYRLKAAKENLRRVPHKGVGYGVLRYLTPACVIQGANLDCRPEISFNYLGQFHSDREQGLFDIVTEPAGHGVSPDAERPCQLEFSALVLDGRLRVTLQYNTRRFSRATAQGLLDKLKAELDILLRHCLGKEGQEITPSDLTYGDLTLDELDNLFT